MNAKSLATALLLAVSCTAIPSAFAQLPDAPAADSSSAIGIDAFSFWAGPASPCISPDAEPILLAQADAPAPLPIAVSAGTGADTRLGVDLAAADKASEGWPWYGKVALVVGCVAITGLAAWAIVESSHSGSHDNDTSQHLSLGVGGEGNTVTVHYHSPTTTSTSTSTQSSSDSHDDSHSETHNDAGYW